MPFTFIIFVLAMAVVLLTAPWAAQGVYAARQAPAYAEAR